MTTLAPLEVLTHARDLFAQSHWTQGTYYETVDGKMYFCSIGAVRHAFNVNPGSTPSSAYFRSYERALLCLQKAISATSIIEWNDDPERTKDEVIEAFDQAIELAREGI